MTDISSDVGTSVSDVKSDPDLKQLYPDPSECTGGVIEGASLDELGNDLTEYLHIQDIHKSTSKSILVVCSDKSYNSNVEKEDKCEEHHQTKSTFLTSEKCLSKSTTFLGFSEKAPLVVAVDGEDEEVEDEEKKVDLAASVLNQHNSESSPTPLKLVSAIKGSREKEGMPPKKLSVTWAPDVYDPPPSPSTTVRIVKPRPKSENKKNGKKKRKGKSSKGGSSKDAKQVRKHGGSSYKCYQSLDDYEEVTDYNPRPGDFEVGSPDPYCGSSFLKKSVTKLHFSVAEAT